MGVDIEALRALCEKASPAPWRECVSEVLIGDHWWRPVAHAHYRNEDDAVFIAASRELVPQLIAEVERLTREVDEADICPGAQHRAAASAAAENERLRERIEAIQRLGFEQSAIITSLRSQLAAAMQAKDEACGIARAWIQGGHQRATEHRDRIAELLAVGRPTGEEKP